MPLTWAGVVSALLTVPSDHVCMSRRPPIITALAVTIGLLAACGGESTSSDEAGDDEAETTTIAPTTTAATTVPPSTEPPPTDPPPTDPPPTSSAEPGLPEWASGQLVTVETDTGPLDLPVELVPFCESSRSFYIAAKGLDFVAEGQSETARQLFAALAALAPVTIETAPSADFAVEPTAARDQLAVLIPAFEQVGYGQTSLQELADPQAVLDTLGEFGETRDSLQAFLVQACGADDAVLVEQARGATAAAAAAAGETLEPEEPAEPVEAAAGVPITNPDSNIAVSVPAEWAETGDYLENERHHLVASADIDAFADLTVPGVLVLRGRGGLRDGGFTGQVLTYQADLEEAGCVVTDERDYYDGTYAGQERVLDCGTDGLDVRLFGGTNEDESLYAMVLLVSPTDEPGIRQLIVNTFLVS